jgi:hypothetical protein
MNTPVIGYIYFFSNFIFSCEAESSSGWQKHFLPPTGNYARPAQPPTVKATVKENCLPRREEKQNCIASILEGICRGR